MKKVIRLTESDLRRIVKRVINESTESGFGRGAHDLFEKEGFKRVSNIEYKNDKTNAVVKYKKCDGRWTGFILFKGDVKIYEGCGDDQLEGRKAQSCWDWWKNNIKNYNR